MTLGAVTLAVRNCARCNAERHTGVVFAELGQPIEIGDLVVTHWATCPATGEPLLLHITPSEAGIAIIDRHGRLEVPLP